MELEGNLSVFSLPEILQFLAQGNMSGILTLLCNDISTRLEIREGKITDSSTMDRPLKLGEMLVHRNLIPRRALDEALTSQRNASHSRMLGELLIERQAITQEELRSAIRLQMEEDIWEMFAWHEGTFKFDQGRISERPVSTEIEIEPLLLEGSRRQDEWTRISKNISDDDAVFAVIAPQRGEERSFPLKEREWTVLSLVNGYYNASSIISRTGYGTFETYQILSRLLMAGLIQKIPASTSQANKQPVVASSKVAPITAPMAARTENGNGTSSGLLGLLRKKSATETPPPDVPAKKNMISATTPVGCIVAYVNDLLPALSPNVDFNVVENGETTLETIWRQVVNICPRADLIKLAHNQFSASRFERFVSVGAAERMQTCYEESVEALGRLLGRLYTIASQRLGERNANRIFHSVSENVQRPPSMAFEPDFILEAFVSKAIG